MATRLKNLPGSSIAALRGAGSGITRFALKPLATVFKRIEIGGRKFWCTLRQLSGDDAYERYLAHHAACHAGTPPHSREAFFRHQQQHKWDGIKRCC